MLISKIVARAFATINIFEVLGELKSAFGMWDMEHKGYFLARLFGFLFLGIGTALLLVRNEML
ncbi:hypothetical protein A9G28_05020 [Gilliamella sp. Fer1-1]|jgi:hypothetical protein|uniref:hypothetical protein n=1 Tax=unclassified Gilliamella TaxID=2685620 RepID=UPI00080E9DDB|nr:hypothetical protein [Gilliamella apicola]OCG14701.1 hypothetical protein A9G47_13365 [Gilliamella apicola]OCG29181.1 hypothetical protein A9G45_04840 [Gilliamella apicola]OCG30215.1 hypothetical protein A9G46_00530 [Gilliamella apicola]OCG42505.1 hypothetical protein A9G28_05020 [Gilliamella apicola]